MLYSQQTDFQKTFYSYFRGLGQQPRPFPFLPMGYDQYLLMRDVFRRLQPFQFLQEGDRAVQVGFTDSYLWAGLSHPLIMSAIVGERGHVLAIDLDERNVDALNRYVEDNRVGNVTVVQAAIWKECEPVAFAIYERSSTTTAVPVIQKAKPWLDQYVGTGPGPPLIIMDAVTLDSIVGTEVVDFVNLTVNGAESECMQGAAGLIERNPDIALAFPAGNVGKGEYDRLESLGFDVGLSHASHAPWEIGSTFYACAASGGRMASICVWNTKTAVWLDQNRFQALGFVPLEGGLEGLSWDGKRMF